MSSGKTGAKREAERDPEYSRQYKKVRAWMTQAKTLEGKIREVIKNLGAAEKIGYRKRLQEIMDSNELFTAVVQKKPDQRVDLYLRSKEDDQGMEDVVEKLRELETDIELFKDTQQEDQGVETERDALTRKSELLLDDMSQYIRDTDWTNQDILKENLDFTKGEVQKLLRKYSKQRPTKDLEAGLTTWSDTINETRKTLEDSKKEYVKIEKKRREEKRASIGGLDQADFGANSSKAAKEKANAFLATITDAAQVLKRYLSSMTRKLQGEARKAIDTGDVERLSQVVSEIEKDRAREKDALTAKENNKENSNSDYDKAIDKQINLARGRIDQIDIKLEQAKAKLSGMVKIDTSDFTPLFDTALAAVRDYQQTLGAALKETDVNTEIAAKEDKLEFKKIVADMFSDVSDEIEKEISRFENYLMEELKSLRQALPKSALNGVRLIQAVARDSSMELMISVSTVHREILRAINVDSNSWDKNTSAALMLYLFKSLRVAVSWLAFYIADKLFTEYYTKGKNAAANPRTVDLRWYVAIYASFQFVFDLIALVVMYFVRRIDPDVVSGALILDYTFDSAVVTLMVLSSSVWLADIVQDKKYFEYRTSGKRAVRSLRTVMVWLLILHSLVPYFYFAGPNFTGRAKYKEFDTPLREAREKRKGKAS